MFPMRRPPSVSSATCFPDLLITVATWPAECFFCRLFPRSSDHRNRLGRGGRHGGRPVIQGWVYNDYGRPVADVRLLVETLDASGNVIARDIGFVRGVV
jgi:hypothetical protein